MEVGDAFIQTILTTCPYCLKSVTLQSIKVSDHWEWGEKPCHNRDCPIAFVVEKNFVREFSRAFTRNIAMSYPLIFLATRSKLGIVETIEEFTKFLTKAKDENERNEWAESIAQLQKWSSLNSEEILEKTLNAVQTGLFGLRIYIGLQTSAYLWKWRDRYFGFAYDGMFHYIPSDWILVSRLFQEAKEFAFELFCTYDEYANIMLKAREVDKIKEQLKELREKVRQYEVKRSESKNSERTRKELLEECEKLRDFIMRFSLNLRKE